MDSVHGHLERAKGSDRMTSWQKTRLDSSASIYSVISYLHGRRQGGENWGSPCLPVKDLLYTECEVTDG